MHYNFLNSLILGCIVACAVQCYDFYDEQKLIYVSASVGGYIVLNCDVEFPQSVEIAYMVNWNKGGETIFSSYEGTNTAVEPYLGRIELIDDQTDRYGAASINLTAIRESDGGLYQCKILFPNRTPNFRNNGTWYHLTVDGAHLLAIPPVNQTVEEGEEAQMVCLTKNPDNKPEWFKDGIELSQLDELLKRSWITDEGSLVIRPTDMEDYGEYECKVSDGEDSQSAKAYLNVQYKAKVLFAPPEIHLPYGRPAILDCHFRSNPPLTDLRWEKDGFLFDPYNIHGVFLRRNGSLYISSVNENHNGIYTCTPYNSLGTLGPSPPMRVIVQRPPVFVVTPHHLYLKKVGETLEIPCDARDGENGHRPVIIWYRRDGAALPVGRYSIKDGNLTIINILPSDRGLYQCSATNQAATITAEAEVLVETVPSSAPHNLTAVSTPTTVRLTWESGRQRQGLEYSVWYKQVDQDQWSSFRVASGGVLEGTVTNLKPDTEYELMVMCKDENNDGIFSKSVRIFTKNLDGGSNRPSYDYILPVGEPRNVTVHHTDLGYLVTWDPPEYGIEYLQKYIVRWIRLPDNDLLGSAEAFNNTYLITHLSEGHNYEVLVLAVSTDNQQSTSESTLVSIPGYKRISAVSTAIISCFAIVVVISLVIYYVKKRWFPSPKSTEQKSVK